MTKKNILLGTIGLLSLATLYAFTHPGSVRETVFTLFSPAKKPSFAKKFDPEISGQSSKFEVPAPELRTSNFELQTDTLPPLGERYDDFINGKNQNPIDLKDPKVIQQQVEYDPVSNMYIITEKIGDDFFRAPTYMTFDEYMKWRDKKQQEEYFDRLQGVASSGDKSRSGITDPIAKFDVKNTLIDRLFGGTNVDIKPQGNINLKFGFDYQKRQNPILTLRQQRFGNFDFDMDINVSAAGKIGEKLNLNFNYNTQATFDIDNQMKLNYDTKNFSEDEIIQGVEAGNVSLPLRSNLIKGAQNLFGFKTSMKFGHLNMTLLAAQQRSRQSSLSVQGGSQIQTFERPVDEYDENRHFFISHWNRAQFEPALMCLPVPQSLFTITRMEVWITNDRLATQEVRDIVALQDLAEPYPYLNKDSADLRDISLPAPPAVGIKGEGLPANQNNQLYADILDELRIDSTLRFSDQVVGRLTKPYNPADPPGRRNFGLKQIRDFEKVRARQLSPSEYTFNDQLGFISINLNVQPDQVVGVALEYTYNGIPYKIGEFSNEVVNIDSLNQSVLFVKMLKSTTANVRFPIWDLMMKNVYSIGSVNVDPQQFRFDIYYEDPGKGQKRFLNADDIPPGVANKPLLQLFRLDTLNLQGDPGPDGIFDFVPGLTINLRNGRIMFPVLEPFGSHLAGKLSAAGASDDVIKKYAYPQLYDSTLFRAREFQQLNRFMLRGTYKSSTSSEISLGTFNLPQGSVRVSAGGRQLVEGADYIVDYNIGKVKILNDAILQSGQSVNVSFEDNTLFGFQNRTMLGARFDYTIGKDINIGATYMNLFERPLTQKVNFGDDPINNKMFGFDFSVSKEAPWLTKLVDKIPLINTKEVSSITAQAEIAALKPGHSRAINQGGERGGIVYIDDFEGSTSNLPLANPANAWVIASVPQGTDTLFPESRFGDSIILGVNRARLAWYIADPIARTGGSLDDPYTRLIQFQDIFPNRQLTPLEQSALRPLDVTIFPRERGPYNFDLPADDNGEGYPGVSAGFTTSGELNRPETRWAGFMKGLNTNDFEASNIEFIEFWVLNPYMDKNDGTGVSEAGNMYIDLGAVSEDIMRDSRQFFENALPTGQGPGATANTRWGRVPVLPPVVNAFDNDPAKRTLQDLGLDGMNDTMELAYFADWAQRIRNSGMLTSAKDELLADPSNDNFRYFRDPSFPDDTGLLERYRKFNGPEGNSPVNNFDNLNPSATNFPDSEDLNRDNSLNETEAYFRYKIHMAKADVAFPDGKTVTGLDVESPALRDFITDTVVFDRGDDRFIWYRFKVPLDYNRRENVGGIQDFRSIRFIRMLWKGFTERTTFRFATLELGRNQWRRFSQPLPSVDSTGVVCDVGIPNTPFDVNAVSIEENAARTPFNYTIPYGISREQSVGAFPDILQNEQALSMTICSLGYCDARAIFKTLNMDLRQFERLKMFVHAESIEEPIDSTDMSIFIRLGSDFFNNFYEYEIPLVPSNPDNVINLNPESRTYKEEVWRPENNFDFPLNLLVDVKKQRNADPTYDLSKAFITVDPNNPRAKVKIKGNPNLGYVKGIMVGVRNVDTTDNYSNTHCVETWINELRLNGFNEQSGFAGQARVDIKLADLGNISFSGNYSSIGWGSIEQKLIQRQREEIIQYDISTNLELGKFLPEKSGLRIPFYAQYSNTTKNPEYDPYDLDIKLKDKLNNEADPIKREEIRTLAQDVTTVRGFNFTNVRKERVGGARKIPLPWNIENFSLTYAFNQQRKRDPFIINDQQNQYKGGLDYQYATGLKPFQPFKKLIKKDKYFKWITEMNFNPIPNTYGFNTNLERLSQSTTYRFAGEDPALNTYYNRRFTWDRNYDLGWDITKNLRFNFDATARSLIDEPQQFKADGFTPYTKEERRDSIIQNLKRLGRPKNYTHNASLNYTLPFKLIPLMDWITVKASYTASYTWTAQSLKLQFLETPAEYNNLVNSRSLGNVIQNTSVRQINGEFNFETLYNKSKYLAKINKPAPKGGSKKAGNTTLPGMGDDPMAPGGMGPGGDGGDGGGRPGRNRADKPGAKPGDKPGAPGDDTAGGADKASKDKKSKDKKDKNKDRQPSMAERIALRPLMMVRRARGTYSENFSTVIPGFTPDTKLMGLSEGFAAPGWAFVAGIQPDSRWLDEAAQKGWITQRPELNQQVMRNYTQNFDATVTIEPFQDFRVELNANRQYARNSTELFKDQNFLLDPNEVDFQHRAARDMGSFTVSYFTMKTLFSNDINGLFGRYQDYRAVISNRLGINANNTNPHIKDGGEYAYGYGKIQQEVLIPSFIAAYSESDPNTVGLDIFKTRPAVNWKLTYNGLAKVGNLSKIFASIQITHGYKNTLSVNSYNTDIFYDPNNQFVTDELSYNYIARFEIPQVLINEQMSPLLGVDVKLKNDMTFKVNFKKSRMLAMSFIDYQLAESRVTGYTFGFGYRMRNVELPFLKSKKKSKSRSKKDAGATPTPPAGGRGGGAGGQQANDMTFKLDFDLNDDITVNHRLDQIEEAIPTRGGRKTAIDASIDYALNRRLTLRLFTKYDRTVPKTSQSFPITTISSGVAIQFQLN